MSGSTEPSSPSHYHSTTMKMTIKTISSFRSPSNCLHCLLFFFVVSDENCMDASNAYNITHKVRSLVVIRVKNIFFILIYMILSIQLCSSYLI